MYRQITIVTDLTKQQREEEKNLKEELKRKRDMGEEGWHIKCGELVHENYQRY